MALRGALDLEQIELFVDKRNVIEKMKDYYKKIPNRTDLKTKFGLLNILDDFKNDFLQIIDTRFPDPNDSTLNEDENGRILEKLSNPILINKFVKESLFKNFEFEAY